jgi:BlaI family penicillinase repressor
MASDLPRLSRAEWEVMNLCWKLKKATAREVHDLISEIKTRDYRSTKTVLDRVVAKGYLRVETVGPVRVYLPKVPRAKVLKTAIEDFVTNVLDDSVAPIFLHLARTDRMSEEDVERLRKIVEEGAEEVE